MIYLSLVHNLALLVSLSLVHGLLIRTFRRHPHTLPLLSGLLFGTVAILGMLTPMRWQPGVIFDGRSIVLGAAGLFGGPLSAGVAALMAGTYRASLGGAGMYMGLSVILESALLGVVAWGLRRSWPHMTRNIPLYLLGLLIHGVMLALMMFLPGGLTRAAWQQVALPVILLYPPAFMLLGRLFVELESHFITEEALRASETRNRALLTAIPDLMFVFARDGRILDYQAQDPSLLYAPPETFMGKPIDRVLPPDLSLLTQTKVDAVLATNKSERYEYSLSMGPETRHYESRLVPSGPNECLAIVRDITEAKKAQEALRESEALYQDLVTSGLAGIYRLREDRETTLAQNQPAFQYDFLNDRYCEITGISREKHLAQPDCIHQQVHPDDRAQWLALNLESSQNGRPFSWEGRVLVDGRPRYLHFESKPRTIDARTRLWTGVVMDIDARKQAESERQELERRMLHVQKLESLGVLAGGMAHDFNNILMAILGHADLALAKLPAMSPARDSLGAIESAARRASDLSRQMLAYSGRGKFVIESIRLEDLVSEMMHILQASISKKALLNLNLEKGLPAMEGDATQVRQILLNLVTNASEAIGDRSGVITISTGAMYCRRNYLEESSIDADLTEGLYVFLEVSDTGCGMDKETMNRIFEPFFTTKFTGRGLGMAAVLGIVRGHHGAIRLYSEVGKGSTFKVLFPAQSLSEDHPIMTAAAAQVAWRGAGTVLLVDDEETLRALGTAMLQELGFTVITANDGREALKLYQEQADTIALVLLDLTMPHMDGEETFRELRLFNPRVRVMLSSGYTEQEVTARFAGKGLAGFIQKPYTLKELAGTLQRVLETAAP